MASVLSVDCNNPSAGEKALRLKTIQWSESISHLSESVRPRGRSRLDFLRRKPGCATKHVLTICYKLTVSLNKVWRTQYGSETKHVLLVAASNCKRHLLSIRLLNHALRFSNRIPCLSLKKNQVFHDL